VYEWIEDARIYEDPDFRPVDDLLLKRLLKVALAVIQSDQKECLRRSDLELKWCTLFLHFKNHSRDEVTIGKISEIFLHNVVKPSIPADIQIRIIKDIPFSRYSKEMVRMYTAILFASDNVYDVALKFDHNLMAILKSCANPSLSFEMISTIKYLRDAAARFAIEKNELFNWISCILVRLIGGDEEMWTLCAGEVYCDILFLKNTSFKDSLYGMRHADLYKENLSDVLLSHCVFEKMEDMVSYTLYATNVYNQSGDVAIQDTLLYQARFLYDRRHFAASATLLEAIFQYFSDSLCEDIEAELANLHHHATFFYIESQNSLNQIDDWIDQYFHHKEDYHLESKVLGKLCMALFSPKDKMQESSSFAILNRLSSILGNFY
jgi:hypothetical protein